VSSRHEPGTGSAGDGDDYFLALLYTTDELGRVLTQFAQTNGFHTDDSGTCATAVVLEIRRSSC